MAPKMDPTIGQKITPPIVPVESDSSSESDSDDDTIRYCAYCTTEEVVQYKNCNFCSKKCWDLAEKEGVFEMGFNIWAEYDRLRNIYTLAADAEKRLFGHPDTNDDY